MGTKQVIIIRKDLHMRKGKMVAQGAHASLKVLTDHIHKSKKTVNQVDEYKFCPTEAMIEWLSGDFTKICVYVESEQELIKVYSLALIEGLLCSLILDSGKTEFKEPTYTAVAIGPAENEKIDKLTGHLKLL
jgi:PTH2 family peptidyl-tRNA hydrolase